MSSRIENWSAFCQKISRGGCSIQFITVPLRAFWVRPLRAVYALFIAAPCSRAARPGNCDRSIWIEFSGLQSRDP